MSNDKQQPQRAAEIQVKRIRFIRAIDIPGKSVTEGIESKPEPNRPHYLIVYVPHMRHHQITFVQPERAPQTIWIHESRVETWAPA